MALCAHTTCPAPAPAHAQPLPLCLERPWLLTLWTFGCVILQLQPGCLSACPPGWRLAALSQQLPDICNNASTCPAQFCPVLYCPVLLPFATPSALLAAMCAALVVIGLICISHFVGVYHLLYIHTLCQPCTCTCTCSCTSAPSPCSCCCHTMSACIEYLTFCAASLTKASRRVFDLTLRLAVDCLMPQ